MALNMSSRFSKIQVNQISIEYAAVNRFWNTYSAEKNYIDNRQRCNIVLKHSFAVIARDNTALSLSEIGSVLSKDHASILHAKKNHESNLKYLPDYERVYKDMKREMLIVLCKEEDTAQADDIYTIKELRTRMVDLSVRLRGKIEEINVLKADAVINPARLLEENQFLKKHNREIHDRNKRLEKELTRVKNLI